MHYSNIHINMWNILTSSISCDAYTTAAYSLELSWKKHDKKREASELLLFFLVHFDLKIRLYSYIAKWNQTYLSFWMGRADKALQSHVQGWHSSTPTWSLHRGTDVSMCPSLLRRSRWSSCACPHTPSHRHQLPGPAGIHSGRSPQSWCSVRSYKCQVSGTHQYLMDRWGRKWIRRTTTHHYIQQMCVYRSGSHKLANQSEIPPEISVLSNVNSEYARFCFLQGHICFVNSNRVMMIMRYSDCRMFNLEPGHGKLTVSSLDKCIWDVHLGCLCYGVTAKEWQLVLKLPGKIPQQRFINSNID